MIELITGHGADNHISSNDFRAFNRANFGQGRYILNDENNMVVSVSAVTGSISIASGSCMWSGMHIRLASPETLTYIVPATTQTVGIYLHYTKDVDTLIETVELKAFIGSVPSPIVDDLSDNTSEAYTLFYSFTASATDATNAKYVFKNIKSNDDIENLISDTNSETILFSGRSGVNSTIILTESIRNFREVEFISESGSTRIATREIPKIGDDLDVVTSGPKYWNGYISPAFPTFRFVIISDAEIKCIKADAFALAGTSVQFYGSEVLTKIIGIGRIS